MPAHRKHTRKWALLALATATVLVASGCSIQPKSNNSGGLDETTVKLAADDGSPTYEQTFNPYSGVRRLGSNLVYEPLMVLNTLDGSETPFLATGYEFIDPSTIAFTVREGVTWSDGEDFSADDVVFTFELLKEFPALDTLGVWQQVDDITADGQTVTFHLNAENVNAVRPIEQTLIVPEHIWADIDDPTAYKDEEPVGTGPFTLGEFAPTQYTMTRNVDYWQADNVEIENVVYTASNTQLDIVNGAYDWGYAYISDVEKTWVGIDDAHNYWYPAGGVITLYPNLTDGPLSNVDVRRGVSAALDRDAIADDAVEGYLPGAPQTGLILPGFQSWTDPDIADSGHVAQDADAALGYFEAAGYTQKDGQLVDASGKPLELSITTANGYTDWLRAVQAVQGQLEAVGITVNVEQPQPAAYQQALQNGDFDLAMGAFGGTGSIFDDYNTLLNSAFVVPVGEAASGNFQRYSNPAVDDALAQLKVTTDVEQQKELSYVLQQAMYEDIPVIAMYYGGLWGIYSDAKFTGWPSAQDPYASPKTWDSSVLSVVTNVTKAD